MKSEMKAITGSGIGAFVRAQRANEEATQSAARARGARRGRESALLAIAFATVVAVLGCGGHNADRTTTQGQPAPAAQPVEASSGAPTTEAPRSGSDGVLAVASHGSETASLDGTPGSQAGSEVTDQGETLAPDVVVSAADTLVTPGQPLEIAARGTSDIVTLVLWDGINDKQAFTYDTATKLWRIDYRVPLQPGAQRIGLSVTARNAANRWRRVWLFLNVQPPAEEEAPASAAKS
jgi:hypothetical protein